ncbi:MAG: hypothetical protein K6A40_07065 [Solobacterium sp.]|nr:hypothetical protein [Solobacterium sp.]
MIGRQVLVTNRSFTLAELEAFMQEHWDTEVYNTYKIGRPTPVSVEEYILLPATPRFTVIVYPRSAGGLFSKDNKVILTTTPSEAGAGEMLLRSVPARSIVFGAAQISSTMSTEKERKGPAEEILLKYTEYMRGLLKDAGYLK